MHVCPEFVPWHREFTNRFEALLRTINPQLSLHYWDFKEDPRAIADGNVGGGARGMVNLFDADFMGASSGAAGDLWLRAGFYDPLAGGTGHPPFRGSFDNDPQGTNNPADTPRQSAGALARPRQAAERPSVRADGAALAASEPSAPQCPHAFVECNDFKLWCLAYNP